MQKDQQDKSFFGAQKDIFFMKKALALAKKAALMDEVPIGAIVVNSNGNIIGRGFNHVEQKQCQIAHAEMSAIKKATKMLNNWRLEGCWLYVTLQPCSMCMGLIKLSRLAGVVYGATSPLFGYHKEGELTSSVYKSDFLAIIHNICAEESVNLLQTFFQNKRKKK